VKNSCWKWNETDTIDTICFRANGTVASRESNPRPRASAAASSSDSSSAGERAPADDGGDKPMSEAEPAEPACRPQGAKVDSQNDCCSGRARKAHRADTWAFCCELGSSPCEDGD
jgi:hypothetical protein